MISVQDALAHVLALATRTQTEVLPIREAGSRVLARSVVATRAQPPFATSVMDGYAISDETVVAGDTFSVIGEAAAGHGFPGVLGTGQAVRIFTGAPVPEGARRVVIQEDVWRQGDNISINENFDNSIYIRKIGADFHVGDELPSPRRLSSADITLIAAMNVPTVEIYKKPVVALIATGDELVMPGETPKEDQIIASNALGLALLVEQAGGIARVLPIARDTEGALHQAFDLARGADLIVTIGGASVGDHDLVGKVAQDRGLERAFYKVAMRPGKPLMAGRIEGAALLGLPGNPVSSMVCGKIFMQPLIRAMAGDVATTNARRSATLSNDIPANGPREHYMRALRDGSSVSVAERQDSGLLSVLSNANALVVRPPLDPARKAGEAVEVIDL